MMGASKPHMHTRKNREDIFSQNNLPIKKKGKIVGKIQKIPEIFP